MPVPVETVSAIVLAAGRSRRYGSENKLLTVLDGRPLVRHTVETVASLPFLERIVVVGHEASETEKAFDGLGVKLVLNQGFALGMGGSVRVGIQAARLDATAFLVVLADMPFIKADSLLRMCSLITGPMGIVVTRSDVLTGSPVLFGSSYRSALEGLSGDRGASRIWQSALESVVYCDVDASEHRDIDTLYDLGSP